MATNQSRVYRVSNSARFPDAGKPPVRLVRARDRDAVYSYAARELLDIRPATQADLEELLPKGVPVEQALPPAGS